MPQDFNGMEKFIKCDQQNGTLRPTGFQRLNMLEVTCLILEDQPNEIYQYALIKRELNDQKKLDMNIIWLVLSAMRSTLVKKS